MNRRGFLGALAVLALPVPPMPLKPTLPEGFMRVIDYTTMTFDFGDEPRGVVGLLTGEIGRYEGVRFIESACSV